MGSEAQDKEESSTTSSSEEEESESEEELEESEEEEEPCATTDSKVEEQKESSTTVKFNVGGKLYEVSKSLLEGFPDTMLAEKTSSSPFSPIYIDRDPDRFAFCLDYMRDNGTVYLPETVSKLALLRELEFFGFVDIDETKISNEKWTQNCMARCDQITKATKKRIATMEKEARSSKRRIDDTKQANRLQETKLERELSRTKLEIQMEKFALDCRAASVTSTRESFRVINSLWNNEHADQYFIDCCDKLGLSVDVASSKEPNVFLKLKKI